MDRPGLPVGSATCSWTTGPAGRSLFGLADLRAEPARSGRVLGLAGDTVTNVTLRVGKMTGAQLQQLLKNLPDGVTYGLEAEKDGT